MATPGTNYTIIYLGFPNSSKTSTGVHILHHKVLLEIPSVPSSETNYEISSVYQEIVQIHFTHTCNHLHHCHKKHTTKILTWHLQPALPRAAEHVRMKPGGASMLIWLPALTLRAKVNLSSWIFQRHPSWKSHCNATMANGFTVDSGFTLTWRGTSKNNFRKTTDIRGIWTQYVAKGASTAASAVISMNTPYMIWGPLHNLCLLNCRNRGIPAFKFSKATKKKLREWRGEGGLYTRHSEDETYIIIQVTSLALGTCSPPKTRVE